MKNSSVCNGDDRPKSQDYLNENHPSKGLQNQRRPHGQSVHPGVVLYVRVQSHAIALRGLVPLYQRGILQRQSNITLAT